MGDYNNDHQKNINVEEHQKRVALCTLDHHGKGETQFLIFYLWKK